MLAVTLNQHLIKRRKQEEYKTAHSSPPDYETKNIVSSSDGVSCAEKDEYNKSIPYAYEEYDGNWMMCDEAEEMEAYKKDIKKNEKLLPVSMPINSYMWTGDKFSTWYSGVYEIAIEDDMTKEYAKELAKKFAR